MERSTIADLKQQILGWVARKQYLMDLMTGNRERHEAEIASWRKLAAEFTAKANMRERELDPEYVKGQYIKADDAIAAARQQIAECENTNALAQYERLARELSMMEDR